MRGTAIVASLVFISLLSGCLQGSPSGNANLSPTESPNPTASTNGPGTNDTWVVPREAFWSNCHGIRNAFLFPPGENPNEPPEGWDSPLALGSDLGFELFQCERISWGTFERGPTYMMIEYSDIFPPQDCRGPGNFFSQILSIWFDDPEIAAFVNQTYGLVTHAGNFTETATANGAGKEMQWQWQTGDFPPSKVRVYTLTDEMSEKGGNIVRFYDINKTRILALDIRFDLVGHVFTSLLSPGTMSEPMLFARTGLPYLGRADVITGGDMEGKIHFYEDVQCEEET